MNLIRVLFLVIISLAMYLSTFTELKSECPQYFTQTNLRIWVYGCEYDVEICFQCNPSWYMGDVYITGFGKVDPECNISLSTGEIYDAISSQVMMYEFIKTNICDIIALPCFPEDQGVTYTFSRAMCMVKTKSSFGRIWYSACDTDVTTCTEQVKVCYDPNFPPTFFRETQISGPSYTGSFGCSGVEEPPNPDLPDIPTICFEMGSPCNPIP